jgi:hypothetical protein
MDRFDQLARELLDEEDPLGRPARVAAALRWIYAAGQKEERERCIGDVCQECRLGMKPRLDSGGRWRHATGIADWCCDADAIRRRASQS